MDILYFANLLLWSLFLFYLLPLFSFYIDVQGYVNEVTQRISAPEYESVT